MLRTLACLLSALLLSFALAPSSAEAQVISRNNPYRSFNISGINYGSTQWERQNRRFVRTLPETPRQGIRWVRRWR